MADRMDEILRTVAQEADRGVDYAALHDAILVAHKKKQRTFSSSARMLSYAAVFVVVIGLGALAFSRELLGAAPKSTEMAAPSDELYGFAAAAEDGAKAPEAPAAMPEDARSDNGAGEAVAATEAPMLTAQSITGSGDSFTLDPTAYATEVLATENAVLMDAGTLSIEPDKSLVGQSLCGGISCNTSYSGVYIEPMEGAPALSKALVADYGNGELHIYWSASKTLHVYATAIGYTAEDAIALLTQLG